MSTTTPEGSSSPRRKAASTTNVAPCSRWAGPNISPRKLWATIMWSRTVTLNIDLPLGVADGVAERWELAAGQPGHHVGQVLEGGLTGDQRVEGVVPQQV